MWLDLGIKLGVSHHCILNRELNESRNLEGIVSMIATLSIFSAQPHTFVLYTFNKIQSIQLLGKRYPCDYLVF